MGKKSGSSGQQSGPVKPARQAMNAQFQATLPILQLMSQQITEALRTGGVNSRIPIMQQTVAAGRKATSDTVRGVDEANARGNMGPYGRNLKQGAQASGDFNTSQAAMQIIQQLMGQGGDYGMMRGSPVWGSATMTKGSSSDSAFDVGDIGQLFKVGQALGMTMATGGGAAAIPGIV